MKKKHRDIVIDDIKYGWIFNGDILSIWKDNKKISQTNDYNILRFVYNENAHVTPKGVDFYIRKYVLNENVFRCEICKDIFIKLLTEEGAEKQLSNEFPGFDKNECDLVCDDCFEKHFG